MEGQFSWRHALALLITLTSAWLIWHGTRLVLTEPDRTKHLSAMHVSLAQPLAPPAPPKVIPKPPPPKPAAAKQPVKQQHIPVQIAQHAIGPQIPITAPAATTNSQASPPAPPAPPAQNVSLENAYLASARAAIEEEKRYPMSKDARIEQPQGTATVWFVVNRAGELQDAGIEELAGSILDRAAIESVRRTTFAPFPATLWPHETQHRFTVSLHFAPG